MLANACRVAMANGESTAGRSAPRSTKDSNQARTLGAIRRFCHWVNCRCEPAVALHGVFGKAEGWLAILATFRPTASSSLLESQPFLPSRRTLAAVLLACAAAARAGDLPPSPEPQRVLVTAHEPAMEQKRYRDLLSAMTRFEPYRAAHPDASLRFRIYQRKEGVDFAQLRVWLRDPESGSRVEVALAPDGGFELPLLPELRDHDAEVRTNMPDGTLTWAVEVRRPGDDDRHHLLGDMREACLLDVDFAHLLRGIKPPAFWAMDAVASNICLVRGVSWGAFGGRAVFSVHLNAGDRHVALLSDNLHGALALPVFRPLLDFSYLLQDRCYVVPLNDASWPDETSVDLVYADDPDDAGPTPPGVSNTSPQGAAKP